jgi:tripartite-type tricarboxylate transporter receptor subunit TctC
MKKCIAACIASLVASAAGAVAAQDYPSRPIRVVTGAVGGGNDLLSRFVATSLTANLKRQVIVDNRPSGPIPGEIVARATPDGYTLMLYGTDFWIGALTRKMPYDPVRDFDTITIAAAAPNVLIVHPAVAAGSVKDLVALAGAKPGALNYGSSAVGGVSHLAAELFKQLARVNIVHVPYKGTGPGLAALIGGEIQMMFPNVAASLPHIKSGRIKALAVTSAKRSQLLPDFPTVAESGLPGYDFVTTYGVFGPRGLPRPVVVLLNREIANALASPQVKEPLANSGMEVVASSPEALAVTVKSETARFGKLVREVGIQAD